MKKKVVAKKLVKKSCNQKVWRKKKEVIQLGFETHPTSFQPNALRHGLNVTCGNRVFKSCL